MTTLRDLCNLARTCRTWNDSVNPKLYANLYIPVSSKTGDTEALDAILGASDEKINSVLGIHITPPPNLNDASKCLFNSCRASQNPSSTVHKPQSPLASSFTRLICILLRRIPRGNLKRFMYVFINPYASVERTINACLSWALESCLNKKLVTLLLQRHGSSLIELQCNGMAEHQDVATNSGSLRHLVLLDNVLLNQAHLHYSVATLLASNRETLSALTLGSERHLVTRIRNRNRSAHVDDETRRLITQTKELVAQGTCQGPLLTLESLKIIANNPLNLIGDVAAHLISFTCLTTLILDSCLDLPGLFSHMNYGTLDERPLGHLRLRTLMIRHEESSDTFKIELRNFLCLLHPLKKLCILLEGEAAPSDLGPVLQLHGQSLRCLIWDEKKPKRSTLSQQTMIGPRGIGHLELISKMCPELVELGVSIWWTIQPRQDLRYDARSQEAQQHMQKLSTA